MKRDREKEDENKQRWRQDSFYCFRFGINNQLDK